MNSVATGRMATDAEFEGSRAGPYPMGLMAILATVSMLFAAFTAAILFRRTGIDWVPVPMPAIVWANTLILLVSSGAVELARASVRRDAAHLSIRWLAAATVLGFLFLAGQVFAWHMLAGLGVFLPTNPHAAFFYMLTAIHGAHVIGGLIALSWTLNNARRGAYTPKNQSGLNHAAIYWHFIGGVWVYLLAVLSTF